MTDAFKKQSLETDFGQKVAVVRNKVSGEDAAEAVKLLLRAGNSLNPVPRTLEYMGSMAVHIYKSPALEQVFFISQTPLGHTSEDLASKALTDLRGSAMEAYKRKRQVKRSGF